MKESKRLFVGNLPPNVTEDDLFNEFSSYGKVASVDIKTKEGGVNSDKSNKFGFVQIEIDDYMARQCIQEFRETAYKGFYLTVSVAKESFLDKLKREREEAAAQEKFKQAQAARPKVKEVESEEFVIKPSKFRAEPVHRSLVEDEETSFQKRAKGAYFENGKQKILGGTGTRLHADQESGAQSAPISGGALESNQKRLQSLQKMKQAHDQQKFAIRNALKNSDGPRNNKIVFDAEESAVLRGKAQLFDEDDENDFSADFKSKKQFEGEQGQKLLELKTRFKNDDRFQMDEDFFEGKEEDVAVDNDQGERQRQLEILGSVVGKSFDARKKKSTLPTTMLRFDPTKATHQKFYKHSEDAAYQESMDTHEEANVPKVSADQFYKVSNTIGQAIQGDSQGFSLLKMMGHETSMDQGKGGQQGDYYAEPIAQRQNKQKNTYEDNPFKYDSSDDESGQKKRKPQQPQQTGQAQAKKIGGKTNKRGIFRENFFILPGDARLEQGLAFFQAGPRDKTRNFQEIKKNLKKVVSKKVRKNKSLQKASLGRRVFKQKK